jgi:release factor glutamine methyltransferase
MTEKQAFDFLSRHSCARDAAAVLRHIMGQRRKNRFAAPLFASVWLAARKLRRGAPVAKVIGRKWFYGLEFQTGRHTLDPRPDSETLVDAALGHLRELAGRGMRTRVLDLGTGTGCLIAAIVKNIPGAPGVGIDKSRPAVRVARRNIKKLGLAHSVKIMRGDFAKKIGPGRHSFDVIVSNPPYIAKGDARVDAGAQHDPKAALYAGRDGMDAYRVIAARARESLAPGGRLFLEIGAGQGAAARNIFACNGWRFIAARKDYGGIERVLEFA